MAAQYWDSARYSEWCGPEPEIDREKLLPGVDEKLKALREKMEAAERENRILERSY